MPTKSNFILPKIATGANIGILGGSFDPPHLCHELLALSFLALEPIDELWVIPCANHAFKNELSDFKHRFSMCKKAFSRIKKVRVLDIEKKMPIPNYTINTIEAIKNLRPDLNIFFALGSDLIESFKHWHRVEELALNTKIIIFEREGYNTKKIPKVLKNARVHDGFALPNTSSSNLRRELNHGQDHAWSIFLDKEVLKYIRQNNLYT